MATSIMEARNGETLVLSGQLTPALKFGPGTAMSIDNSQSDHFENCLGKYDLNSTASLNKSRIKFCVSMLLAFTATILLPHNLIRSRSTTPVSHPAFAGIGIVGLGMEIVVNPGETHLCEF